MTVKIKDISVNISVYFAALITFLLIFAPNGSALTALVCCIIHEIGHLAAIYIFGGKVSGFSLGAYGMRIDSAQNIRISPGKEAIISFAGPFTNILIIIFGLIIKSDVLIKVNLCLCIFNLLPVGRTDGYNTIYNGLSLFFNEANIKDVLRIISTSFLIIIYIFGIIVLIKTKFNFSLLAAAVYLSVINTIGILKEESL